MTLPSQSVRAHQPGATLQRVMREILAGRVVGRDAVAAYHVLLALDPNPAALPFEIFRDVHFFPLLVESGFCYDPGNFWSELSLDTLARAAFDELQRRFVVARMLRLGGRPLTPIAEDVVTLAAYFDAASEAGRSSPRQLRIRVGRRLGVSHHVVRHSLARLRARIRRTPDFRFADGTDHPLHIAAVTLLRLQREAEATASEMSENPANVVAFSARRASR